MSERASQAIIMGVLTAIFVLIGSLFTLFIISLLPIIFICLGDWAAFTFWLPIAFTISRVAYVISIFIAPALAVYYKNPGFLLLMPLYALMAIWGIPLLLCTFMTLATTVVTGLELQKLIIIAIFLESFQLSLSISSSGMQKSPLSEKLKSKSQEVVTEQSL